MNGHNIKTCYTFKKRLLELIKIRWVTFGDSPNVNLNHLPNHAASNNEVSMMEVHSKEKMLKVSMKNDV